MTNRIRLVSNRNGMRTYVEDNPHDEMNPIIHEHNDVGRTLDQAKIFRDDLPPDKEWRAVMTIPPFLMNELLRTGKIHDQAALRKMANDSNYAYLRLWRGRV